MKLVLLATKDGRPGPAEPLAELDRTGFRHVGNRVELGPTAHDQIRRLFGSGYMTRTFYLEDGDEQIGECSFVEASSGCVLEVDDD